MRGMSFAGIHHDFHMVDVGHSGIYLIPGPQSDWIDPSSTHLCVRLRPGQASPAVIS